MNKLEIQVSYDDLQDMKKFCEINNIELDALLKKSFKTGYNIEKYGLLGKTGGEQEKWVEKEVIVEKRVEVPVEVIREVEKVVEKIIEVPIEIVKEIPVEKVVFLDLVIAILLLVAMIYR